jgi:hypothetical protein
MTYASETAVIPDDQVVPAFVLAGLVTGWAPANKATRLSAEVTDKVELEAWNAVVDLWGGWGGYFETHCGCRCRIVDF